MSGPPAALVRELGLRPYKPVWQAMRDFTDQREASTPDEIWLVQHPPVFTQGQAGKPEHVIDPGTIPIVQTDRGGQITYHGPGQLVVYPLLDLDRLGTGIRGMVDALEETVICLLGRHGLAGVRKPGAPGVFIGQAKIASIGMKVRRGCTFHGLAFNLSLDLEPFARINPCGYAGQQMTRLIDWVETVDETGTGRCFVDLLSGLLGLDWKLEPEHDDQHPLKLIRQEPFGRE